MGFYPTREAVQKLIGYETQLKQPTKVQHYTVTVFLFIFITVLGISVRSLGKVYTLIGGFAGTCLSYVLPAAACLISRRYSSSLAVKAPTNDAVQPQEVFVASDSKFGLLELSAIVLFIWGIVVMIFATAGSFK